MNVYKWFYLSAVVLEFIFNHPSNLFLCLNTYTTKPFFMFVVSERGEREGDSV